MKVRVGFVTNSSSTSYCIIGVEEDTIIDQIMKSLNISPNEVDVCELVVEALSELDIAYVPDCDSVYGVCAIGESPEWALESMTLPQAREAIAKRLSQAFNIDVPTAKVDLLYGTAYN